MGKRLYVHNLSYRTSEDELRKVFAQYGEVVDVYIPTDRDTGRPRGFAFVEMADEASAERAIQLAKGYSLGGQTLNVNESSVPSNYPNPIRSNRPSRTNQANEPTSTSTAVLKSEINRDLAELHGRLDILDLIEHRLSKLERILREVVIRPTLPTERDLILEQARGDEQLLDTLLTDEGLGLEMLLALHTSGPLAATAVAERSHMNLDVAMPILARLVQFGAIGVRDEAFQCTERGDEFLRTLEKAAALGRVAADSGA